MLLSVVTPVAQPAVVIPTTKQEAIIAPTAMTIRKKPMNDAGTTDDLIERYNLLMTVTGEMLSPFTIAKILGVSVSEVFDTMDKAPNFSWQNGQYVQTKKDTQ